MPHISKQKLSSQTLKKLFQQFVGILASKKKTDTERVLLDLLTDTEKVMLAKRLAAILLLSEGVSLYMVAHQIKLSTSTVQRMKQNYDQGAYVGLTEIVQRRTHDQQVFMELVNKIARAGMPEMGKNRWKSIT